MNSIITYGSIFILLLLIELVYFRVADYFNIIDKPNKRSSHSTIVLRGGGIIFSLSILVWMGLLLLDGNRALISDYLPFIIGLVLIASVSFIDDIHSLPYSFRLLVHFVAMSLMLWSVGIMHWDMWWLIPIALFVAIGATNFINFMDGINGITPAYGLAMLIPILLLNNQIGFIEESYLIVAMIGILVFSIFNFRPKGKAKCFAGDVGSIALAFIIIFALGKLMLATGDVTYIIFFLLYGVDGSMTIFHRIMLHENLGKAHRKHAYQLMANELNMSHVTVSLIYMGLQLIISLGFIYVCPNTLLAHWAYLVVATLILAVAYILFMRKYYHLHEEYLASINSQK